VIADLEPPRGSLLEDMGHCFVFCPADVTHQGAVRAALDTARDRFGSVFWFRGNAARRFTRCV
jgi:hypothetical protein